LAGMNTTGGQDAGSVTSGDHDHTGGSHTHSVLGGTHTHTTSVTRSSFNSPAPVEVSLNQWNYRSGGGTDDHPSHPRSHAHNNPTSHSHGVSNQGDGGAHHAQDTTDTPGSHTHGGGQHTHTWDNQPAYYILAFIMKVSDA